MQNSQVVNKLKFLVRSERALLDEVLMLLKMVEARKLYLEMAYSSLFAFCTEELGYSGAEAQTRILAMRLMKDVPSVRKDLRDGKISLSVAAKTQSVLRNKTPEEKAAALESVKGLTYREAGKKLQPEKRRKISFYPDDETIEMLEKLRGLMAHKNYDGSMEGLVKEMARVALKKYEKKHAINAPRLSTSSVPAHFLTDPHNRWKGTKTYAIK
jgi:hypothetical protein